MKSDRSWMCPHTVYEILFKSAATSMATVQNFKVISDIFNVTGSVFK